MKTKSIIFLTLLLFICKRTRSDKNNFQSLWFDAGLDPHSLDSPHIDIQQLNGFRDLKDGQLISLMRSGVNVHQKSFDVKYTCLNDTEKLIEDLSTALSGQQGQEYAIKFLDADGKIPPGILQGHWSWVGDYQECNSIDSTFNKFTNHKFKGKYFSVAIYINGKPLMGFLPVMIGTCLPDSCDISDARALSEVAFAPLAKVNITVVDVITDEKPPYDGAAIATFTIIGIVGFLVLLGSLAELWIMFNERYRDKGIFMNGDAKYGAITSQTTERTGLLADGILQEHFIITKRERLVKFFLCFSFIRNTKKLLNTSTAKGPLACLNGLRVVSMWWVIQGHTYSFTTLNLSNTQYAMATLVQRFTFQPVMNGTFSVDTFFFLSGLLVAYLALREIREHGKLSWIYYFLHRYWRLTPLYVFVLLIFMSLFVYFISGPFQWLATDPIHGVLYEAIHGCRDYWWSNLLYINNFYPNYGADTGCMGWAWYLANDMQFYIVISPILIILFRYHKTAGLVTAIALILACVSIRGFLVSWYGITMMNAGPTKHTHDPWGKQSMYVRPWARMSVYIVGFLTGFALHHIRCRLRMNKFYLILGWCLAIGTALAVIYGMYYYNSHPGTQMTLVASGFYVSLSRTAWALSLSWLVLTCATGYGGPVHWFLSWKVWAPLGRLTYAAYLVHPLILVAYQFNLLTPLHFTDLTFIYLFVSNLVFSYLAAYIVSMVVEAPMMAIEKLILNKQT